jgi:hypothetical protein
MPQEAPYESSRLVLTNLHDDDAIAVMPQLASVETTVAGEEGRIIQASKGDRDLVILETLPAPIHSNLPHTYAPGFEQLALSVEDILIQKDQAGRGSILASVTTYWPE